MYYAIDGNIRIDSLINIDSLSEKTKFEFKESVEKSFQNAFDSVMEKYNFTTENPHDIFIDYLDFEKRLWLEKK